MDNTNPKPFVFVLMPFSNEFRDIYEVGIKPACKDAGTYCERVDEQIFVENILERVYNQISKADVIVAEMTGRNANVFYETGYAHALNKRVILLTQTVEDIPFDLKHYPHIVYGDSITTLKSQLEARIKWCVDNPQRPLASVDLDLRFLVNEIPLVNNPVIEIIRSAGPGYKMRYGFYGYKAKMTISIHNKTNKVVSSESFSLALITPKSVELRDTNGSLLPNDLVIWNFPHLLKMFPDGWQTLDIQLLIDKDDLLTSPFDLTLRLFTELGPKDFQFRLHGLSHPS
jgi:hypothetical protein